MTQSHDRPKRFIAIVSSADIYGSDRISATFIRTVRSASNVEIEVWVPDDCKLVSGSPIVELESIARIKIVRVPIIRRRYLGIRGMWSLLVSIIRFREVVRKNRNPDVVYLGTSVTLLAALVMKQQSPSAEIWMHMQEMWGGWLARVMRILAQIGVDRIICISEASCVSLGSRLQPRATVIQNSVPDAGYCPPAAIQDSRPFNLLVASRWNQWKGHATLLDAWARAVPNGRLSILGGPLDDMSVDVPEIVQDLRLENIEIIGQVNDINPYIRMCDAVVVPSDEPEPFGLVAIEALSIGRPVIGTDGGGLAEVIQDGVTGWIFPRRDSLALAAILEQLTPKACSEMSRQCRLSYENKFSQDRYQRDVESLTNQSGIRDLADERRSE